MNRRSFNAALAGMALLPASLHATHGRTLVLKAEFAAHIPAELKIAAPASGLVGKFPNALFELRVYRTGSTRVEPCLETIFPRVGIHPVLRQKLTYLIPFENLTAREQAWNRLNADPEWHQVRREVDSYQFGLYRVTA